MAYYIDIRLHTNAEISCNELMAALFYKVHIWLAKHAEGRIGVSFPEMKKTPGGLLRVHGDLSDLITFASGEWRNTLSLWISQTPVQPIPAHAQSCCVTRIQSKSAHNKRQRAMRRRGLTLEEATACIPDTATKPLNQPFLDIRSASTGQRVRFFIQQQQAANAVPGRFSAYGMGQAGTTVPWFDAVPDRSTGL